MLFSSKSTKAYILVSELWFTFHGLTLVDWIVIFYPFFTMSQIENLKFPFYEALLRHLNDGKAIIVITFIDSLITTFTSGQRYERKMINALCQVVLDIYAKRNLC